uniref:Histone acetyltransferase n=1 Tax=Steinernema glaseri TaxID=37863 RepID=A0A1I7ZZM4_9BILA
MNRDHQKEKAIAKARSDYQEALKKVEKRKAAHAETARKVEETEEDLNRAKEKLLQAVRNIWLSTKSKKPLTVTSLAEDPVIKKEEHYIVLMESGPNTHEAAAEVLEEKIFTVPNPLLPDKKGNLPVLSPRLTRDAKEMLERLKKERNQRAQEREEDSSKTSSPLPKKMHLGTEEGEMPKTLTFPMYYVHYLSEDRRLDRWLPSWKFLKRIPFGTANLPAGPVATRSRTTFEHEFEHLVEHREGLTAKDVSLEKEREEQTKIKLVEAVRFSNHVIESWYFSPYPEVYAQNGIILICEFCLLYTFDIVEFNCHKAKACKKRRPPGREIYRKDNVTVFEVNGEKDKLYCQSLCLLGKLFLDHKTLLYDVDKFVFYVLCETHGDGSEHPVGFFSKEPGIPQNNLACIMVLPPHQRKGYGSFLIQLSYELSRRDKVIAGPEYPLSDMGKIVYRKYWNTALLLLFRKIGGFCKPISLTKLSMMTGFREFDILYVIKLWKLVDSRFVETYKEGKVTFVVLKQNLNAGKKPRILLDYDLLRT